MIRHLITDLNRLAGWINRRGWVRPALVLVFLSDRLARLSPAPLVLSAPRLRLNVDALKPGTAAIWLPRGDWAAFDRAYTLGVHGKEGRA